VSARLQKKLLPLEEENRRGGRNRRKNATNRENFVGRRDCANSRSGWISFNWGETHVRGKGVFLSSPWEGAQCVLETLPPLGDGVTIRLGGDLFDLETPHAPGGG